MFTKFHIWIVNESTDFLLISWSNWFIIFLEFFVVCIHRLIHFLINYYIFLWIWKLFIVFIHRWIHSLINYYVVSWVLILNLFVSWVLNLFVAEVGILFCLLLCIFHNLGAVVHEISEACYSQCIHCRLRPFFIFWILKLFNNLFWLFNNLFWLFNNLFWLFISLIHKLRSSISFSFSINGLVLGLLFLLEMLHHSFFFFNSVLKIFLLCNIFGSLVL